MRAGLVLFKYIEMSVSANIKGIFQTFALCPPVPDTAAVLVPPLLPLHPLSISIPVAVMGPCPRALQSQITSLQSQQNQRVGLDHGTVGIMLRTVFATVYQTTSSYVTAAASQALV